MPVFAVEFNLVEFVLNVFVWPTLICLAVVWLIGHGLRLAKPYVAAAWRWSGVPAFFRARSKATLCFLIAVTGNGLEVFFCTPLLGVPYGSGVKPMSLPVLFIVIAAATFALCKKVATEQERRDGPWLLGLLAVPLCLTPFFVGVITMHWFAALNGLQFG